MKKWLTVVLVALLSACGSGLDGTYTDETGISSYTFNSDGKVAMKAMGSEIEMDYKVEDGKVKIGTPEGALVLTILEDGSLSGPMMRLTKKEQ